MPGSKIQDMLVVFSTGSTCAPSSRASETLPQARIHAGMPSKELLDGGPARPGDDKSRIDCGPCLGSLSKGGREREKGGVGIYRWQVMGCPR